MKWTKVRAGHYVSGAYTIRQATWRASKDGWIITGPNDWHDSSRLLESAKQRCAEHATWRLRHE